MLLSRLKSLTVFFNGAKDTRTFKPLHTMSELLIAKHLSQRTLSKVFDAAVQRTLEQVKVIGA